MMADDIRVKFSFRNNRKHKRLHRLIGVGATYYLINLWIATAEAHPDGCLNGWDETDIADACDWHDSPDKLVSALLECQWIEQQDGHYVLHDWEEHQGWVFHSAERSESARNAARMKWQKIRNAECMRPASAPQSIRNAPSPSPTPIPSPNPSPRKRGSDVNPDFLLTMKQLFPGVNVDLEWEHCKAWCLDNNKNLSRTRLMNWLKKTVERGSNGQGIGHPDGLPGNRYKGAFSDVVPEPE